MADFSKDIIKELKESNKRLEALERQGKEDDSPRAIIAQAVPEVLAAHRYPRVFQEKQGLYEVDDILKKQGGEHKKLIETLQRTQVDTGAVMLNQNQELINQQAPKAAAANDNFTKQKNLLEQISDGMRNLHVDSLHYFQFNEKDREKARTKIVEQEDERKKLVTTLESQGKVLTDQRKYNQLTYEIARAELDLRLKNAVGSAERKEIKNERKALDKENAKNQGLIAKGLGGLGKWLMGTGKKMANIGVGFLKGLGFVAVLLGIIKFLDSDFWKNFLEFLRDPSMERLGEDFPKIKTFVDGILKIHDIIDGHWGAVAIAAAFTVPAVIAALALAPILTIFIGGMALAITDGVRGWFLSDEWGVSKIAGALGALFGGAGEAGSFTNVTGNALKWGTIGAGLGSIIPVVGTGIGFAVGALFGAILGFVGGENMGAGIDAVVTFVSDMWKKVIWQVKNNFRKLFGMSELPALDTPEYEEHLATQATAMETTTDATIEKHQADVDAGRGHWEELTGPFGTHFKTYVPNAEGDQRNMHAPAPATALTPTIVVPAPAPGGPGMYMSKELREFLAGLPEVAVDKPTDMVLPHDERANRAAGGWMSGGGPTMVGELGPELIFPSTGGHVMNAQRTAQILASGINRGMPAGGGGPALINAPVTSINNNQSSTTVASTPLTNQNPLLASVNLAA